MRIALQLCGTILLLIIVGCGPKPSPTADGSQTDEQATRKAFEQADKELGVSEVERDLSGVVQEATGEISEILDEPDRLAMKEYQTGKPGWIKVTGNRRYDGSIAPDIARQKLLQILRNEAVNKKVATTVELTTLLTDVMSATGDESFEQSAWSGFFRSTVSGVITDEKYVTDSTKNHQDGGYQIYLTLDAFVVPVTGQRDPGFYMTAGLSNDMLKDGEKLVIQARPSKDAYVYIINLMADNNAMLMFPNDYMQDNFIAANETLVVPDPKIQKYISFIVGTMPGQKLTSESVYIICTNQRVPVIESLPRIGTSMQVFSGKSQNFINLQRWLTSIPLDQRIEKVLLYHVSK